MFGSHSSSPELLAWSSDFELDVPDIDAQHRHLLDVVNRFARAVACGEGGEAMADLLRAAHAHFDFEEALMARVAFPGLALHHEQHSELLAAMDRFDEQVRRDPHVINRPQTLEFLRAWFTIHIVRSDADLAAFLAARAGDAPS